MGLEPPRSFPISWYCKLDTGMQKPKLHPELQMQQMLQVDLLLRLANLTSLVPTWHGAPSQVNHTGLNWSTSTAPHNNFQNNSQSLETQDPGTTQPEGNSIHLTIFCSRCEKQTIGVKNAYCSRCENKQ